MRIFKEIPAILSGLLLLILPLPARCQIEPPEPGAFALSFAFPSSGSSAVGVRKVLGSGTNAGLDLRFSFDRHEVDRSDGDREVHEWEFGVHPDLRFYRRPRGTVLPFLDVNAGLSLYGHDGGDWAGAVSVGTGIGVEWFPVSSMSVSGKTGLAFSLDWMELGNSSDGQRTAGISTNTSSLSVNLYF